MNQHSTVMGPGETLPAHHLAPSSFLLSKDKLRWRKDVRCWAVTVRACADGGDDRAKGMHAALVMLMYRSLPPSRQQSIEKSMENGELVLDPSDSAYANDVMKIVKDIIKIVAKDSAPDAIKRLAKLSKKATSCLRSEGESMSAYIERFLFPAQSYLNPTNADRTSAESQNLAMVLFSNASLSQETFASVMAILVSTAKTKSVKAKGQVSI